MCPGALCDVNDCDLCCYVCARPQSPRARTDGEPLYNAAAVAEEGHHLAALRESVARLPLLLFW